MTQVDILISKNQVLQMLQYISKNCELEKEVEIATESNETSIASHAARPVENTELYAPA